jgi:hypothetical protein
MGCMASRRSILQRLPKTYSHVCRQQQAPHKRGRQDNNCDLRCQGARSRNCHRHNYDPPNAVPLDTWILGRKRRPHRIALEPLSYTDPRVNPNHVPATASPRSTVRRESVVASARWLVFPPAITNQPPYGWRRKPSHRSADLSSICRWSISRAAGPPRQRIVLLSAYSREVEAARPYGVPLNVQDRW